MKQHEYYKENNFNPTTFDITSEEKLKEHFRKRNNLHVNKLSIPNLVWKNSKVLEVGCASGENSLLYAIMGAKLTLIEPVSNYIDQLKQLFSHYNVGSNIENIIIDEIENIKLSDEYDIIVAEGFLEHLSKRTEVMRKLFKSLKNGGLFILTTKDMVGSFIEVFKASLAQLYCKINNIVDLEEKVNAVRPFFENDFNQIPHSRSFDSWAKDVLLDPIITQNRNSDFDEIVADLEGLNPVYYSSCPSYKHTNNLLWYKIIIDNKTALKQVINSYKLRRVSYLLGEVMDEKESLKLLYENINIDIKPKIKEIMCAIYDEMHNNQREAIYHAIKNAESICGGKVSQLLNEMLFILKDITPKKYEKCVLLRKCWGIFCHNIVFTKDKLSY